MAKEKITEEELVARINTEVTDALGYGDTISQQREKAMEYYYGLPFGNEVEGRSQFIDSTVQDTIEWIKPSLMRVFASGDEMVKFNPHGPEDVAMADQASDYVNYVFTKDNPGWEILYSWFTDALLSKNGIVKVWWDEYEDSQREEYRGLDEIGFSALINSPDVEVLEHTEYQDAEYNGYYSDCNYYQKHDEYLRSCCRVIAKDEFYKTEAGQELKSLERTQDSAIDTVMLDGCNSVELTAKLNDILGNSGLALLPSA